MRISSLALLLFLTIHLSGQDLINNSIITEGRTAISITPEIIVFYIDFETLEKSYNESQRRALEVVSNLKLNLNKIGIDSNALRTGHYSVRKEEDYDCQSDSTIFIGYKTKINLRLALNFHDNPLDKVYNYLNNNFKHNYSIQFELEDYQFEEVKEQLIIRAIKDATFKAEIIAENSGLILDKVIKVQYGDSKSIQKFHQSGFDLYYERNLDFVSSPQKSKLLNTLVPQDIKIKTNILMAWSIK